MAGRGGGFGVQGGAAPEIEGGVGGFGAAEEAGFGEEQIGVGAKGFGDGGKIGHGVAVVAAESEPGSRQVGIVGVQAGDLAAGGGGIGCLQVVEAMALVGLGGKVRPALEELRFIVGLVEAGDPGLAGGGGGVGNVFGKGEGFGAVEQGRRRVRGGVVAAEPDAEGVRPVRWRGLRRNGVRAPGVSGQPGVLAQEGEDFLGVGLVRGEEADEGDELLAERIAGQGGGGGPVALAHGLEDRRRLCCDGKSEAGEEQSLADHGAASSRWRRGDAPRRHNRRLLGGGGEDAGKGWAWRPCGAGLGFLGCAVHVGFAEFFSCSRGPLLP